jgi:catechol 2,3-dioxygenase-like lactoylglutathione lyase family enzyme
MNRVQVGQLWKGRAEPILPTASIERVTAFWTALGFSTEVWEDDGGYAWVYPGEDRAGISIDYSLTDGLDPFTSAGMTYLSVPDADAVYAAILATGTVPPALDAEGLPVHSTRELRSLWRSGRSLARMTRPIDQVWGKRELALFDPDNNLIRIGSAL